MTSLKELKTLIKETLTEEGLGPALKQLKATLPENSKAYDEAVLLEAALKEANLKMARGSIGQTELDVLYNSLRARLMTLLDSLDERDLEAAHTGKKSKQGSLLYQIPHKMELEQEARCRVRIAYDEAILLEDIELTSDTRIKEVRIAEVMEVELIDPTEVPAFSIRTFNRQEQFLEKEEYTEWIFFVKPLREGRFPLLLRVSIIEMVGEKERVRDIVLEETVVIVAEPVDESAAAFKPSGYVVGQAEGKKKKKTASRKPLQATALALAALIAFSGITYAAVPPVRMNVDWVVTTLRDNREAYQDFAEKYEGKPKAKKALEKVEEIDWKAATQDTTVVSLEQYLELHPEGRFAEKAKEMLETMAEPPATSTSATDELEVSPVIPSGSPTVVKETPKEEKKEATKEVIETKETVKTDPLPPPPVEEPVIEPDPSIRPRQNGLRQRRYILDGLYG